MAETPGTVIVPDPALKGSTIRIHKDNTYVGIKFHLGSSWAGYLDGTYDIHFTAKRKSVDPNASALFDVAGTVDDQNEGIVSADLDSDNTDITAGEYMYQLQIKKADDSEVKVAIAGRIVVQPTLLEVP